jgi:hypothetical protein
VAALSGRLTNALTEKDLPRRFLCLGIARLRLAKFPAKRQAALDRRPRTRAFEPILRGEKSSRFWPVRIPASTQPMRAMSMVEPFGVGQ